MNKYEDLKKLQKNAYSKYSKFNVSCIIVTNDDSEFKGVNVENIAFGDTICAERSALVSAISNGYREFKELHLLTDCEKPIQGSPCGACRQVMSELIQKNTKIFMYGQNKEVVETNIVELLPYSFDASL